jgi:hypothetical protein
MQYYYNLQFNVTVIMDDEFDDKGWDGDMGDGEVSKIIGILFFVSCFIL